MPKFLINLFLLSFFTCLLLNGAMAQESQSPVCGTDEIYEAKKKANPRLQKLEEEANEIARKYANQAQAKQKKDGEKRVIPVVFHVVHEGGSANIDEEQILANLETMNKDFQKKNADTAEVRSIFKDRIADYNIEFRRARVAPDGSCTDGITRTQSSLSSSEDRDAVKSLIRWNTDHYLNIWIIKEIGGNRAIAGFAQFPWDQDRETDGIVVRADQVRQGDRTLTHEVGHYLGLLHPFQGGCSTGDCDIQNDQVCDVPPTESRRGTTPCGEIGNTCNDPSGEPDMKENFMDYTTCPSMFTEGQKARSEPFITQSRYRQELFSDENLIRTGVKQNIEGEAPLASFIAGQTKACVGQAVEFNNLSCAGSANDIEWRFEGGTPESSASKNPTVFYNQPGEYDVWLKMSNSNGSDTLLKTDYIKVIEPVKAPVNFTFQGNNLEAKGYEFAKSSFGDQWKQTSNVGLSGNQSLYLGNYNILEENQNISFVLPPVDLTEVQDPVLRFDMAYATKDSVSGDQLRLERSEDCGKNWQHLKFFFNNSIITQSNVNSPFYPESSEDWKTHQYSLSQMGSANYGRLRFEMQTDQGNNVFIDNVRIESKSTSIEDQESGKTEAFTVYPNPVDKMFEIEYNGTSNAQGLITVTNAVGKHLQTKKVDWQSGTTQSFKTSSMNMKAPGLYIVRIQFDNQTVTKKITLSE